MYRSFKMTLSLSDEKIREYSEDFCINELSKTKGVVLGLDIRRDRPSLLPVHTCVVKSEIKPLYLQP